MTARETVEVLLRVRAEVIPGYGPHELADAVRFHLGISELDSIEADVSAVDISDVREAALPIQPGDLVEHRTRDLDPREVVAIGRDWLTLDIGGETPRIPKDNYRVYRAADGVL